MSSQLDQVEGSAGDPAIAREALEAMSLSEERLRERLLAIALENRRLAREQAALAERNCDLVQLYVAGIRLHESLDRNEVLTAIQEIVINLIGSEQLAVFELARDGRRLLPIHCYGVPGPQPGEVQLGEGVIGRTAAEGRIFIGQPGGEPLGMPPGRIAACAPFTLGDRVTGALALFSLLGHKRGFSELDREVLELVGRQGAVALYSTLLYQQHGAAAH